MEFKPPATLIAFDTSLTCTGMALFEDGVPVFVDHVKGGKYVNLPTNQRMVAMSDDIWYTLTKWRGIHPPRISNYYPQCYRFVFELPVVGANAGGTIKLSMLIGTMLDNIWRHFKNPDRISIGFVNNTSWKKTVTSNGRIKDTAYLEFAKREYPQFTFQKVDEAAALLIGVAVLNGVKVDYKLGIKD